MTDLFSVWSSFALFCEGGLTNDPHDPGGLTNFGIDQRDHPDIDIRHLTRDAAIEIYRTQYWLKSQADQLPAAIAVMYADAGFNMGLGEAALLLQASLGVKVDGHVGPATLATANIHNARSVLAEFASRRATRYAQTHDEELYCLGWMRWTIAAFELAVTLI